MFKVLVKIKRWIFGPRTELEFTERSLRRHKKLLLYTQSKYPHDLYSYEEKYVSAKIKRIEDRIAYLKSRKLKYKNEK